MLPFLPDLIDLTKSVHVELPNEALDLLVPKVDGQDEILHFFLILDFDLKPVAGPTDHVLELRVLEDVVEFDDKVRNLSGVSRRGVRVETRHLNNDRKIVR